MNLSLPDPELAPPKPELSQWNTPPDLAQRIVDFALEPYGERAALLSVLEPSAGQGALARVIEPRVGSLTCIEIDPERVAHLVRRGLYVLPAQDFLKHQPERRYALAIANPPFENGATERHLMHALSMCYRAVFHCPLTTLAGQKRKGTVWDRVDLHRLGVCSKRWSYGADGGKTDMCTIDVSLRVLHSEPVKTAIEWWV